MNNRTLALLTTALFAFTGPLQAQSLKGSRASMERQNQEAIRYGYSFIERADTVASYIETGQLVPIKANRQLELHDVSYPYALPAVSLFLDRLSAQYSRACGDRLTVTSLTRPIDRQPANAANNSVHPTGMAVDLRIPRTRNCRNWLEGTLLSLEAADVLDVTRERNPAHFHVALFTENYRRYVANLSETIQEYQVRPGDSLWVIASRTGTSVDQLRAVNGLSGSLINVGQKLQIPSIGISPKVEVVSHSSANELAVVTDSTHKVRRGDTLWRLSRRYGMTVEQIRMANGLANDFLQVGQVLQISQGH